MSGNTTGGIFMPAPIGLLSALPLAYIGPGAGFAAAGSLAFWLIAGCLLAMAAAVYLPLRIVLRAFRCPSKRRRGAKRTRVVLIGLDGLDPRRARRLMREGRLPSLSAMAKQGTFSELRTTQPPLSPVAWSSFMTGVNPGKHNIFDFIARDPQTYLPYLSTAWVHTEGTGRSEIELLRKSKPFWAILGENGIFSTILRVPVTFPAEPFYGLCLSGMGVPDLRGTQGAFTCYETGTAAQERGAAGGEHGGLRIPVFLRGRRIAGAIPGPCGHGMGELKIPITIYLLPDGNSVRINIPGQAITLTKGVYSDWIRLTFKSGFRRISGICRFYLAAIAPEFRLYLTPINIDPERPAMAVSHPFLYSAHLAKRHGPFATLGMAEDTAALNEGILSEVAFLQQAYDLQREREAIFFDALDKTREGFCACVFELPDRIQHMFSGEDAQRQQIIDVAYIAMDNLVARTMKAIGDTAALLVMSDHGFTGFRRGINLNVWLKEAGLLTLIPGAGGADWLRDVDWEKTKAYSMGLSGIYMNIKGREAGGSLTPAEAEAVKKFIISSLAGLKDPKTGAPAMHAVYDSRKIYQGPYADQGPDILAGFAEGYRASWEGARGRTDGEVFSDNTKHWSGDHCVDAALVPGVFFCNRPMELNGRMPHITDLAPTILSLFGVETPGYLDGKILEINTETAKDNRKDREV